MISINYQETASSLLILNSISRVDIFVWKRHNCCQDDILSTSSNYIMVLASVIQFCGKLWFLITLCDAEGQPQGDETNKGTNLTCMFNIIIIERNSSSSPNS